MKSNSSYKKYVSKDPRTGKDRLYVRLKKAHYGTLKAACLFFKDLTKCPKEYGFKANLYDPCVMNKDIKGSQCTIAWHVDEIKISHKKQSVLEKVLDYYLSPKYIWGTKYHTWYKVQKILLLEWT